MAYKAMLKTELKLSLRGMDMLIFAIIMPWLFLWCWVLFGNKLRLKVQPMPLSNNPSALCRSLRFVQVALWACLSSCRITEGSRS